MQCSNDCKTFSIISIKTLDDCLGGSSYLEVCFSSNLTREIILSWKSLGDLEYHADFTRPLFKFNSPKRFILKGLQDTNTCKLILPTEQREEVIEYINSHMCTGNS